MLNIAVCTKDQGLRKILETALTQAMSSNHLAFHLTEVTECTDIPQNAVLVLGDNDSLCDYERRKMMIVVFNHHRDDHKIAKNCIPFFIEREEVREKISSVLMAWLDYFFDNYHCHISETEDFLLTDVLYFAVDGHQKMKVYFKDGKASLELNKDYVMFYRTLPLNFLIVGTEHIINLDEMVRLENGQAVLSDGTVIPNVDGKKVKERVKRYEKSEITDVYIGDKFPLKHIKKAQWRALASVAVVGLLLFRMLMIFSLPLGLMLDIILMAMLYLPFYLSFLGSSGNYYELRQDGLHYYEAIGMFKRFKWSQAIAKGREESLMNYIPYDDISYVRLGTRAKTSPLGAGFLYLDQKDYSLMLRFETKTDSLEFEETSLGNIFLAMQRRDNVAYILNTLLLAGKGVEGNQDIMAVLNDPNATLQQYMTKKNYD